MASVNRLTKLEHLSVRIENGHVVPLAYAAVDVENEQAGDGHGRKLIVVPLDGAAPPSRSAGEPTPKCASSYKVM